LQAFYSLLDKASCPLPLNETFTKQLGVQHLILPKSGYKLGQRQQHEKQRYFRQGRYWHNGVEGRISYLKRTFGFQRYLCRGKLGFERWVGWGVIAHNLTIIPILSLSGISK
jgi:IS5 family transposase